MNSFKLLSNMVRFKKQNNTTSRETKYKNIQLFTKWICNKKHILTVSGWLSVVNVSASHRSWVCVPAGSYQTPS